MGDMAEQVSNIALDKIDDTKTKVELQGGMLNATKNAILTVPGDIIDEMSSKASGGGSASKNNSKTQGMPIINVSVGQGQGEEKLKENNNNEGTVIVNPDSPTNANGTKLQIKQANVTWASGPPQEVGDQQFQIQQQTSGIPRMRSSNSLGRGLTIQRMSGLNLSQSNNINDQHLEAAVNRESELARQIIALKRDLKNIRMLRQRRSTVKLKKWYHRCPCIKNPNANNNKLNSMNSSELEGNLILDPEGLSRTGRTNKEDEEDLMALLYGPGVTAQQNGQQQSGNGTGTTVGPNSALLPNQQQQQQLNNQQLGQQQQQQYQQLGNLNGGYSSDVVRLSAFANTSAGGGQGGHGIPGEDDEEANLDPEEKERLNKYKYPLEFSMKMMEILWPNAERAFAQKIQRDIVPNLTNSLPTAMQDLSISRIKLGDERPKLGPLKLVPPHYSTVGYYKSNKKIEKQKKKQKEKQEEIRQKQKQEQWKAKEMQQQQGLNGQQSQNQDGKGGSDQIDNDTLGAKVNKRSHSNNDDDGRHMEYSHTTLKGLRKQKQQDEQTRRQRQSEKSSNLRVNNHHTNRESSDKDSSDVIKLFQESSDVDIEETGSKLNINENPKILVNGGEFFSNNGKEGVHTKSIPLRLNSNSNSNTQSNQIPVPSKSYNMKIEGLNSDASDEEGQEMEVDLRNVEVQKQINDEMKQKMGEAFENSIASFFKGLVFKKGKKKGKKGSKTKTQTSRKNSLDTDHQDLYGNDVQMTSDKEYDINDEEPDSDDESDSKNDLNQSHNDSIGSLSPNFSPTSMINDRASIDGRISISSLAGREVLEDMNQMDLSGSQEGANAGNVNDTSALQQQQVTDIGIPSKSDQNNYSISKTSLESDISNTSGISSKSKISRFSSKLSMLSLQSKNNNSSTDHGGFLSLLFPQCWINRSETDLQKELRRKERELQRLKRAHDREIGELKRKVEKNIEERGGVLSTDDADDEGDNDQQYSPNSLSVTVAESEQKLGSGITVQQGISEHEIQIITGKSDLDNLNDSNSISKTNSKSKQVRLQQTANAIARARPVPVNAEDKKQHPQFSMKHLQKRKQQLNSQQKSNSTKVQEKVQVEGSHKQSDSNDGFPQFEYEPEEVRQALDNIAKERQKELNTGTSTQGQIYTARSYGGQSQSNLSATAIPTTGRSVITSQSQSFYESGYDSYESLNGSIESLDVTSFNNNTVAGQNNINFNKDSQSKQQLTEENLNQIDKSVSKTSILTDQTQRSMGVWSESRPKSSRVQIQDDDSPTDQQQPNSETQANQNNSILNNPTHHQVPQSAQVLRDGTHTKSILNSSSATETLPGPDSTAQFAPNSDEASKQIWDFSQENDVQRALRSSNPLIQANAKAKAMAKRMQIPPDVQRRWDEEEMERERRRQWEEERRIEEWKRRQPVNILDPKLRKSGKPYKLSTMCGICMCQPCVGKMQGGPNGQQSCNGGQMQQYNQYQDDGSGGGSGTSSPKSQQWGTAGASSSSLKKQRKRDRKTQRQGQYGSNHYTSDEQYETDQEINLGGQYQHSPDHRPQGQQYLGWRNSIDSVMTKIWGQDDQYGYGTDLSAYENAEAIRKFQKGGRKVVNAGRLGGGAGQGDNNNNFDSLETQTVFTNYGNNTNGNNGKVQDKNKNGSSDDMHDVAVTTSWKEIEELGIVGQEEVDSLIWEMPMVWHSNMLIEFQCLNGIMKFGIDNFSFEGVILIEMKPILNEIPLYGGLMVSLVNPPLMDFDFVGTGAAVSRYPLLASKMKSTALSVFSKKFVLPNSMFIKTVPVTKLDLPSLKFKPPPLFCIRIEILEARNLPAADYSLFSDGTSDPYVIFKLGSSQYQTSVVPKNLHPVWNSSTNRSGEFMVHNLRQRLFVDVFDHDFLSADDHISSGSWPISILFGTRWYELSIPGQETSIPPTIKIRGTKLWLTSDKPDWAIELASIREQALRDCELSQFGLGSAAYSSTRNIFEHATKLATQQTKKFTGTGEVVNPNSRVQSKDIDKSINTQKSKTASGSLSLNPQESKILRSVAAALISDPKKSGLKVLKDAATNSKLKLQNATGQGGSGKNETAVADTTASKSATAKTSVVGPVKIPQSLKGRFTVLQNFFHTLGKSNNLKADELRDLLKIALEHDPWARGKEVKIYGASGCKSAGMRAINLKCEVVGEAEKASLSGASGGPGGDAWGETGRSETGNLGGSISGGTLLPTGPHMMTQIPHNVSAYQAAAAGGGGGGGAGPNNQGGNMDGGPNSNNNMHCHLGAHGHVHYHGHHQGGVGGQGGPGHGGPSGHGSGGPGGAAAGASVPFPQPGPSDGDLPLPVDKAVLQQLRFAGYNAHKIAHFLGCGTKEVERSLRGAHEEVWCKTFFFFVRDPLFSRVRLSLMGSKSGHDPTAQYKKFKPVSDNTHFINPGGIPVIGGVMQKVGAAVASIPVKLGLKKPNEFQDDPFTKELGDMNYGEFESHQEGQKKNSKGDVDRDNIDGEGGENSGGGGLLDKMTGNLGIGKKFKDNQQYGPGGPGPGSPDGDQYNSDYISSTSTSDSDIMSDEIASDQDGAEGPQRIYGEQNAFNITNSGTIGESLAIDQSQNIFGKSRTTSSRKSKKYRKGGSQLDNQQSDSDNDLSGAFSGRRGSVTASSQNMKMGKRPSLRGPRGVVQSPNDNDPITSSRSTRRSSLMKRGDSIQMVDHSPSGSANNNHRNSTSSSMNTPVQDEFDYKQRLRHAHSARRYVEKPRNKTEFSLIDLLHTKNMSTRTNLVPAGFQANQLGLHANFLEVDISLQLRALVPEGGTNESTSVTGMTREFGGK